MYSLLTVRVLNSLNLYHSLFLCCISCNSKFPNISEYFIKSGPTQLVSVMNIKVMLNIETMPNRLLYCSNLLFLKIASNSMHCNCLLFCFCSFCFVCFISLVCLFHVNFASFSSFDFTGSPNTYKKTNKHKTHNNNWEY